MTRIDTTGGRNPTLDIRGFGETASSNLVILVDGVRLNEGDMGGAAISWIPVDSIERIEIVRGSGAVLHGEGATAGMINIITGRGMTQPGGAVSVGVGASGDVVVFVPVPPAAVAARRLGLFAEARLVVIPLA